jgi:sugar/nucleoside kinase (ribokinase family)
VAEGIAPVRVRDLTGAGDAFAGGLIGALHSGATITEAAAAGNAAGSQAVSKLGAVGEVEAEGLSEAAPALAALLGAAGAAAGAAPAGREDAAR